MDQYRSSIWSPTRFDSSEVKLSYIESNYNACMARLAAMIKILVDDFARWQLAESRGLSICYVIETTKMRMFDQTGDMPKYSNSLQSHCDKLNSIIKIFQEILTNSKDIFQQLGRLSQLPGISDKIIYSTWKIGDYLNFLKYAIDGYTNEIGVKIHVMGRKYSSLQ